MVVTVRNEKDKYCFHFVLQNRECTLKVAFASEENNGLDSTLSHHFGRCPYYVFVEIENDQIRNVEARENPYFNAHAPGVVPEFIAKQGANVIVTGGMGPQAIDWFKRLGVQPITGASGKVRDVLNDYLTGKLSGMQPCDEHGRF
jgi:predicted Fe-Mo cluster-binding NifX family protein